MRKIELEVISLTHGVTPSHNYAVVLDEVGGTRRLPIVIGSFEAQAIAVAIEKMSPVRPLTHDLFKNTLQSFDIVLKEVLINNLVDGIFHAKMVCEQDGNVIEIDSRTSDAIAMAVRFSCPIYTFEFVLDSAGIPLDEISASESTKEPGEKKKAQSYDQLSVDELQSLLNEVLEAENYEKAAKIRDEINKRKAGKGRPDKES